MPHNRGKGGKAKQLPNATNVNTSAVLKMPSLTMSVLPRTFRRTLPYAQTVQLTTGAAGVVGAQQAYSINSCFDPDISGVGHQPYGFDQLATWYSRYIVLDTTVEISCSTIGGTADVAILWWFTPTSSTGTVVGSTFDRALETPMLGAGLLSPSGSSRTFRLTQRLVPWKVEGITKDQYFDQYDIYGASVGASPTRVPSFQLATASPSGVAGETISATVRIHYVVEFSSPNMLSQS
jgi:hypothetical protein